MDEKLWLVVFGGLMAILGQVIAAWFICSPPWRRSTDDSSCEITPEVKEAMKTIINATWDQGRKG